MSVFQKVTLESLKKNRVRTIVTIIGIILSASMICAVTTFASSIQNYMYQKAVYDNGKWHGTMHNTTYSTYEDIWCTGDIQEATYMQQLGYAYLENCTNKYKPYLYVLGGSDETQEMLSIIVTEGSYPTASDEILIPNHLAENGGIQYKLGDVLTLELGNRVSDGFVLNQENAYDETVQENLEVRETRTYKVVGFYDRFPYYIEGYSSPGYTAITVADKNPSVDYNYDIYFMMEKAREVFDFIEEHEYVATTNGQALMYLGVSRYSGFSTMLTGLCAIVIGLIMFGSVSLIYNAFSISVSERTKQFGLLSSVGATKKQLKKMVLFEAFVVGMLGVPIGVIAGIVGIGVTLIFVGNKFMALGMPFGMSVSVSPVSVVAAVVISFITVLISAWIPSKRATKVSAVEAIRQTSDIQVKRKEVKTSKLTYKMFGLPGMIASKHYKRNKKKYRTTVMSLFMSIVLFVSASAFTEYLMESVSGGFGSDGYDLWYAEDESNFGEMSVEDVFHILKSDSNITEATYAHTRFLNGSISKEYIKDESESVFEYENEDGTVDVYGYMYFIPDAEYVKLLKEYHLNQDKFMDKKDPLAIVIDGNVQFNRESGKYESTKLYESDEIEFCMEEMPDETGEYIEYTVKSGKVIYDYPYYISNQGAHFTLVYPISMYESVLPEALHLESKYFRFCMISDNHTESFENIESLLIDHGLSASSLVDYAEAMEESRSVVTIIQVFAYGFIVLISLIAAANVFNTISTNIHLRRREFAMLKSVGMEQRGFNRMMNFECLLYGSKSLIFGIPVSCGITFLIYLAISEGYETEFHLPWKGIGIATCSVFLVVIVTMMYSMNKIRKDNPIDALKNENL